MSLKTFARKSEKRKIFGATWCAKPKRPSKNVLKTFVFNLMAFLKLCHPLSKHRRTVIFWTEK